MKKIFDEVTSLDQKCYEAYALSEDILMEHAASALCDAVKQRASEGARVLVLCGPGNNGGDGLAAARMLHTDYDVSVVLPYGAKSKMARLQEKRFLAVGGAIVHDILEADVYVDALFGSGLSKALDAKACEIFKNINAKDGVKISCDIPSGLGDAICSAEVFRADISVSMGAYKLAFFEDFAKDFIGEIVVANLGISRMLYEGSAKTYLLDADDMRLPYRESKNSNKGNFGHTCVVMGEKEGAAILASTAALHFGSGLVSVMTHAKTSIPPYIMSTTSLPKNTSALVVGMGLGSHDEIESLLLSYEGPMVIDADLFYKPLIKRLIKQKDNLVLTPHPKEFASLLKICDVADVDVHEIQSNRFHYVRAFITRFPNITLLLKGANSIIAHDGILYVNTQGSNVLSKGGSGDVLSGMIGALLAQNYSPTNAAISASLAHALAGNNIKSNNYALNPLDLCEGIKCL
ncbi:NAD(P)H-hydrate dehydratase [Sulfurospirillum sp. 1612]|uniref:NAD(P)H-hydrate dehydratase n=1 Tax=Sulfurospirillum sp. 1612 TaxID=3094835 RepID=UPI002F94B6B4